MSASCAEMLTSVHLHRQPPANNLLTAPIHAAFLSGPELLCSWTRRLGNSDFVSQEEGNVD